MEQTNHADTGDLQRSILLFGKRPIRVVMPLLCLVLTVGCGWQEPKHFTHEVLNRMTPIKDQGESEICWAYAMLAAIETEHLSWGDSVNLSPYYIEKMMEKESAAPKNKHGMGVTLIRLIQKYGIVGYDAMRTVETPAPQWVFMLGAAYTPQEFARSVCAPNEYIALTSTDREPYYKKVDIDQPANWLHDRFYNIPMDTLLTKTEQAVREHHGVCWESKEHAMAIVGIAHDDSGEPFFIMKNSWGTEDPYKGLTYLSFEDFRDQTLAIEMPLAFFQTAMVR
ncbi:MAG: C1 family peptidase [Prevotella sp.]|nr:C1 family peptidase [Prevotella sp.]